MNNQRRRPLDGGEDNNGPRPRRSARLESRTIPPQQQPPIIEGNIPQQQPAVGYNVHADAPAAEDNLQPPAADEVILLQPPVAVDDIQLLPPLPPQQVNQQQIVEMNAERPISTHLSTLVMVMVGSSLLVQHHPSAAGQLPPSVQAEHSAHDGDK